MSPGRGGAIALTFDDGPDVRWTPAVLDALRDADARATFFVMAERAVAHPQLIARARSEGHAVELHCVRHVRHAELTDEELEQDTATGLTMLGGLGVRPRLWRAPWGTVRDHSHVVASRHDLRLVHWTADTEDWAGAPADELVRRVWPELGPGTIVLAHDGLGPGATREDCAQTVAMIEPLVSAARARGLRCEPLGRDGEPLV